MCTIADGAAQPLITPTVGQRTVLRQKVTRRIENFKNIALNGSLIIVTQHAGSFSARFLLCERKCAFYKSVSEGNVCIENNNKNNKKNTPDERITQKLTHEVEIWTLSLDAAVQKSASWQSGNKTSSK